MSARLRTLPAANPALVCLLAAAGLVSSACTEKLDQQPDRTQSLAVTVRLPNGQPLPQLGEPPLPLPTGLAELDFDVQAVRPDGSPDLAFEGFVRVSSVPGSVVDVSGPGAQGRNVLLLGGQALGLKTHVSNARGATRLWVEDIGYIPDDPAKPPACANGLDDDGDGLVDFPKDPGCAFANDATENAGTYAAGVSAPVRFELPRLGDVQGRGATTPYELEAVEVATDAPANLIVTRIAADGFYATDVGDTLGYNHVFAFTFSTPPFLRVCDRITKLTGTAVEFFGFTELSFPAFSRQAWRFATADDPGDGPCLAPEPVVIDPVASDDPALLEKIESALVRVENVTIGGYFGPNNPEIAFNNGQSDCLVPPPIAFTEAASNCDLDGSGFIDFDTKGSCEAACANACGAEANCVEWTGYVSRGNYRVVMPGPKSIQINTRSISGFDPVSMRGKPIAALAGTLRNFSGGSLNWTIEARCGDDLVCDDASQQACVDGPKSPVSSQIACVSPRTTDDPNEATN
ncbi:MAG: hypothetical protein IPI67_18295 [Myxococcales bacterium]|nr:hypothetical protein [Myxococcales bacterium]